MKIQYPGTALWIYFGIGFILYTKGILNGTLMIIAVLCGVIAYRLFTSWRT